jgi:hypothetical protein
VRRLIVRRSIPLLVVLLTTVTACSQSPVGREPSDQMSSGSSNTAADAAPTEMRTPGEASRDSGPDINPANAPGVAFNYRYAFRLEADRVAAAQQEHQRLCERFGVARCRITGMTYRAASDEDVEAMLSLRLDPAIAGQFGRESVQAVLNAGGSLADSEITGTDAGSAIAQSDRGLADLRARLQDLEARIRRANGADKGQLELEAAAVRQQISDLTQTRQGQQSSLAMTPMVLRYGSGDLAPGPARPTTLREALRDSGDDFLASLTVLLIVVIRLAPWAVGALLAWALVRFLRRRFLAAPAPGEPAPLGI